jgi:hypothetical protein
MKLWVYDHGGPVKSIVDEHNKAVGTLTPQDKEWIVHFHKHEWKIQQHSEGEYFGMTGTHNMKFESFEKAEQWLSDYNNCQRFGLLLEWAPDGKIIEETWEES